MEFSDDEPAVPLDRQFHRARMRHFHGRAAELAFLRTAMTERTDRYTVAYLHGAGGIGKSTLLCRFADDAGRAGRPLVSLQPGADDCSWQAGPEPPVVLIDDLHRTGDPEQWLRSTVLPAFPVGTLFAVASLLPPSVEWRAEPGWAGLLFPLALRPLTTAESTTLLRALDVPEARHDSIRRACGGNPLALRVAAQTIVADPRGVTDADLRRELALSISHRLIGAIPGPDHRRALEVCAHAATTDENLVRAAVPGADAAALFAWLRDLPFVTSGPRGLHPGAAVRNVVEAELRWRDADQFAAMHERITDHLLKRARTVADDALLPCVADLIFIQRAGQASQSGFTDLDGLEVRDHPYVPDDRAEVGRLARQAYGPETARLVDFWLDRQPAAFHVQRRRDHARIVAFTGQLTLSRPSAEELRTDPVVAAAWSRAQAASPLRPGENLNLVRFLVDLTRLRPSDITTLTQVRVAAPLIRDDRIAWSVIACPDSDHWHTEIARTHSRDDAEPVLVDGHPHTLFSVYRGGRGVAVWSCRLDDRLPDRHRSVPVVPERFPAWDRTEFDDEVRRTLRSWRRPDLLADSALAHSRMAAEADCDDAVTGLRRAVSAALETLGSDPRQAKYHRVLVATFINGAPTQEAAAERLHLPFSTYRRHLARGLAELCSLLWKAESHGLRLLTPAADQVRRAAPQRSRPGYADWSHPSLFPAADRPLR